MDFSFTPEQEQVRDVARRFAAERLAPRYAKREAEARIEPEVIAEMGELGLIGADLPEELGGSGADGVTCGIVIEEVARGDFNVSYVQLLGSLNASLVARFANPDLAREIVPQVCAGRMLLALGLTEPGGGSDAANLRLRARRDGDAYVLDGEKTSISLVGQARWIVLFARTGAADDKARGVSAFLVDMESKGVSRSRFTDVGSAAVGRGSVFFDGVRVPAANRLGEEGEGFRQVMNGFDYSRALIGLQCVGAAQASLDETWAYARERQAFGNPIAKYQGVTQPLAEAETYMTAARLLCYQTVWLRDRGLPHTAEAAMCKWWAPKAAFDAIHQCLITHGHLGYSVDLPHQQRLRDVLGLHIGDGTPQIQKMIIAREKVGRIALPY
jgi:cyclohexanecarboxyl-CoA dehydrogenase